MANNIKINLDTKHLPLTAAAWQSWKIIGIVFASAFITVGAGLVLVTAASLLSNSLPKTQADKDRIGFQRKCQAEFALQNNGMRGDVGMTLCQAQAEIAFPSQPQ